MLDLMTYTDQGRICYVNDSELREFCRVCSLCQYMYMLETYNLNVYGEQWFKVPVFFQSLRLQPQVELYL